MRKTNCLSVRYPLFLTTIFFCFVLVGLGGPGGGFGGPGGGFSGSRSGGKPPLLLRLKKKTGAPKPPPGPLQNGLYRDLC